MIVAFTSVITVEMIYRHFLKEKYQAYVAYTNRLLGMDGVSPRDFIMDYGSALYGRSFYVIDFKDGYELTLSNKAIKTREFKRRYLKRIMSIAGL